MTACHQIATYFDSYDNINQNTKILLFVSLSSCHLVWVLKSLNGSRCKGFPNTETISLIILVLFYNTINVKRPDFNCFIFHRLHTLNLLHFCLHGARSSIRYIRLSLCNFRITYSFSELFFLFLNFFWSFYFKSSLIDFLKNSVITFTTRWCHLFGTSHGRQMSEMFLQQKKKN